MGVAVQTIEADIVFEQEESREELLKEWFADYGVRFVLKTEHGPAGGNPVYSVTGTKDELEKWLRGPYNADDETVQTYLS